MFYRWSVAALLICAGGFGSYAVLFSDSHNDARYVRREAYQNDRERDKELRDLQVANQAQHMAEQDRKLSEISADIKTVLWRLAGANPTPKP
jgi:hypothetical protein